MTRTAILLSAFVLLAACSDDAGSTVTSPDAGTEAGADSAGTSSGGTGGGSSGSSGGARGSSGGSSGSTGNSSGSSGSADAGGGSAAAPIDAGHDAAPAGWVPSIMTVGYGGLRVISRDLGLTWKNDQEIKTAGGDDQDLFRGIAYGNGVWVATGWRFFRSTDGGLTWNEHPGPQGCGLMEGIAYGAGHFVGTCGTDAYTSDDGIAWKHAGPVGDTGGHTYIFVDGGTFYSSGDSERSYTSPDGVTWSEMAGVKKVAQCEGAIKTRAECPGFYTQGVFFGSEWESKITRSTDKKAWTVVHDNANLTPGNNAPYTPYAFALGYSPP